MISCRDRANRAEKELVASASAKAHALLTYLEVEISRAEDARKGAKGMNPDNWVGGTNPLGEKIVCLEIIFVQVQVHSL